MGDNLTDLVTKGENTMDASTEEKTKKTRKPGKRGKATKTKGEGTNALGLPPRVKYECQIGIRLSTDEREELLAKCREEGHHSMSNCVRAALGFPPLR